ICEVPAEDSQIDHILPAAQGGPTRQWNGRPACGFHNRLRNRRPDAG
ncbi:MAG: endonuclease, partial [Actinomycetia bacterium]|nr:endonuclease [Actinomycetes bacterium]